MTSNLLKNQLVLCDLNDLKVKDKTINVSCRESVTLVPLIIRRSSGEKRMVVASEQVNPSGFRKIEPKPAVVQADGDVITAMLGSQVKEKSKRKRDPGVRLLGSNATRRGVRICFSCNGRIGYRSKTCKHCLQSPGLGSLDSSSKGANHKKVLQRKLSENMDVISTADSNDGKENELLQDENVFHRPLSTDLKYTQNSCRKSENTTLLPSSMFSSSEIISDAEDSFENVLESTEDAVKDTGQNIPNICDSGEGQMLSPAREDGNVYQEQISLQDGQFDNGSASEDMCQMVKEETVNFSSDPPSQNTDVSKGNLNEDVRLKDKSTDDVVDTVGETQERKTGCSVTTRRKRKQRTYANRGRKQRRECSSVLQFMRIEPKPFVGEQFEAYQKNGDQSKLVGNNSSKTESVRFLPSNPTRRGIMHCPLCQKEVGCRSKTCKHCKVTINFSMHANALDHNNLLVVQLSSRTNPECAVFSVKKTTTPSEERCCIRQTTTTKDNEAKESEENINSTGSTCDLSWCCECVESEGFSNTPLCEHALCLLRNPRIVQSRTATLVAQKIDSLPIDSSFKNKLKQLWEKTKKRELPLVQQVALNTLVVLDIEKNAADLNSAGTASCVHIRFEKIKRQNLVEHHIFCSGKSCSYWSPLENQKDSPVTCLHYCISLWAIASDNDLQGYFKIFLDAPQVYLHSEVFESIVADR